MATRIGKVKDERHLLKCIEHQVWGSNSYTSYGSWRTGDVLLFICNGLAGIAEVSGPMYYSVDEVWDNGLFPYRVPLRFKHLVNERDRPQIAGDIRSALIREWGPTYGIGILNKRALSDATSQMIIRAITSLPNMLKSEAASASRRPRRRARA